METKRTTKPPIMTSNSIPTWKSTYLETKLDEIKVESVLESVTNNDILVG